MDALYFFARNQFQELATYISLNHQDNSPGYKALAESALRAAKLKPARYSLWNVPNMSEHMKGAIPVDIHGKYVIVDELHALPSATSYGMLRYVYYSCAIRASMGGRWRYDFVSMNGAFALSCVSGASLLALLRGRRLMKWSGRHPFATLSACWFTAFATVVLTRVFLRTLGLGIIQTQRAHRRTLNCLNCVDCLGDVNEYTQRQIDELAKYSIQDTILPSPSASISQEEHRKEELAATPTTVVATTTTTDNNNTTTTSSLPVPASLPASAASSLPPEYKTKVEKQLQIQKELLELNIREVQNIRKRLGNDKLCEVHTGLRSDPFYYCEPNGLELLQTDRECAQRRVDENARLTSTSSTKFDNSDNNISSNNKLEKADEKQKC